MLLVNSFVNSHVEEATRLDFLLQLKKKKTSYSFVFVVQDLPELVLYEIPLIKDMHHADIEEEKISSSSLRTRLLGTLLVPLTVTPANLLLRV